MQQLAGIINESQLNEEKVDSRTKQRIMKKAYDAVENGQELTVNGISVKKVFVGAFSPVAGRPADKKDYIYFDDLANPFEDILIDGEPIQLEPEEPKSDSDFQDRFGPGGGYETPAGRYTGD